MIGSYVIVTDTHRGVVAGVLKSRSADGNEAELECARHCFSWARNTEAPGLFGLAVDGPQVGSLVGPEVHLIVRDVSKIFVCSEKAQAEWRAAKWG